MRLCFDIETDGLLDSVTKCHSLVIEDVDTGQVWSCYTGGKFSLDWGLSFLGEAEVLIGHNILTFDLPVLRKLYPWFNPRGKVLDTLVCSRLIWADIEDSDFRAPARNFPAKLIGSHSLKAWGYRLGELKGDYNEQTDWKTWTPELQGYCEQDVRVTCKLFKLIEEKQYSQEAIGLEHDFQTIIHQQELHGFRFDVEKAGKLYAKLVKRREELTKELQGIVPPKIVEMKTPEYWLGVRPGVLNCVEPRYATKTAARKAGCKSITPGPLRRKIIPFNPGSRLQISSFLISKGWKPETLTDGGQPKIDETILEGIEFPEAKLLTEYLTVEKRIGQIAEGDNAWLKWERNGRIHGRVITNGCVTGRCAHMKPNIGQVPAANASTPYGHECRELFLADEGRVLLGWDASGLELRCLSHYMARYDGGAYGKLVTEGDVHTANQKAAGLDSRDIAKTFIYAYLYGAGNLKIGKTVGVTEAEYPKLRIARGYAKTYQGWREVIRWTHEARLLKKKGITDERTIAMAVKGGILRDQFLEKTPALKRLKDAIAWAVKTKGYLIGLDGRRLHVRYAHAALNTLLQAAGAVIVKKATVLWWEKLCALFYPALPWAEALPAVFKHHIAQNAHIHDESQNSSAPEIAEACGKRAVESIRETGEHFNFRCPLTGEFKIGRNWAETH